MTDTAQAQAVTDTALPAQEAVTAPVVVREHSHGGGAPATLIASRATSTRSFDPADFPRPSGREEDWRFTPLDVLGGLLDGAEATTTLTVETELPDGVEVRTLPADDPFLATLPKPVDRVSAYAVARTDGALVLSVAKEAQLDEPALLRLTGGSDDSALDAPIWGRIVIEVGAFAKATVVLEHLGRARFGSEVSILVGDGASLELVSVQGWGEGSVHSAHHGVRLGRDASISSTQVTLGGALVRMVETVDYAAPGGDAELRGLYFADAGQHQEHRLFVDHSQPNCRSRVTYKGALQGESAHTVWVGDVLIRANAGGTDTYELNRNLILTDGARADSVPNLEIETGEIEGAGHASATGRFDDEQLFYLQSRGIREDEARRLVVLGFFVDILQKITVPTVRERLLAAIEAELAAAPAVAGARA